MCGIFACTGVVNASECVFEGLKRLEYRGYDSWGVAGVGNPSIKVIKKAGKISGIQQPTFDTQVNTAIGHTRWATHGGVTDTNAHPHLAQSGAFALVQNGVVENYQQLKSKLLKQGYEFQTETDTEVIVGLLELYLQKQERLEPTFSDVQHIFKQLEGRNTIAITTKSGWLFAFRDGSPLVLGVAGQQFYLSSDTLSLSAVADEYYALESGQAVSVTPDGAWQCYQIATGKPIKVSLVKLDFADQQLDHQGFDSFMEKEISEQGEVLSGIFQKEQFARVVTQLKKAQRIWVVAAGSGSFAAGQTAWYLRQAGLLAMAVPSYEASSVVKLASKQDCAIVLSQSGETADTNEVVEQLRTQKVTIISLVNMRGSTLSQQLSDVSCMLGVGPEIAVASTKALTAQMLWGWVLQQLFLGSNLHELQQKVKASEQKIATWLASDSLQKNIRNLATKLAAQKHQFILGRGELYYPALEAALKLKEISYRHAEGFSGGELKHGVIALIETGTPVFGLVQNDVEQAGQINALAEVKARGGWVIGVSPQNNELFDDWIGILELPVSGAITPIIPFQLLTCELAKLDGRNPDKPRNLAKSVTVK